MMFKNGSRSVLTRFDVIRNGAKFDEIPAIGSPMVKMNSDALIKMSLSGTFIQNKNVNFLTDLIRPVMIINGTDYQLGDYIATTPTERYSDGNVHIQLEAYDQSLIVKQNAIETRQSLAAGSKYTDVIQSFLVGCGIGKMQIESSILTLQTVREDWEIGTSTLDIINQLLGEINYNSLWFDLGGFARVTKRTEPSISNVKHTYKSGEFSVIKSDCSSALDVYDAYNVFIAVVSSPDYDTPMIATAVNDDPNSELSTIKRGRRIVAPIYMLDNIASQSALQEYINNIKFQSMLSTEVVEYETANMPVHAVGDVVALEHEYLQGIYLEKEWTISMGYNSTMNHKAARVVYA